MSNIKAPLVVLPEYTSVARLESLFGISKSTAWVLLRDGRIKAKKLGGRTLFDVESVRELMRSLPNATKEQ